MKMNNEIIIITGLSAAGKDICASYIAKEYPEYNLVVSTTSRPPRPSEAEGVDYFFVDESEFLRKIKDGEMLEYREYNTLQSNIPCTWFYGTSSDAIEGNKSYVMVLDIDGVVSMKEKYGDRCTTIFIEAEESIRRHRSEARGGFSLTEWLRRYKDDCKRFTPDVIEEVTDYYITNERSIGEFYLDILELMGVIEDDGR
jgi:guanylate kinase